MSSERALLIEWDPNSGKRAGGIDPRDPNLRCYGWQNMDSEPAREIRLVEDDRDLSPLEGTLGVKILEGKQAINDAIQAHIPARYSVIDMSLMTQHMKDKGMSLDGLVGKNMNEIAAEAFQNGIAGVREIKPKLLE